MDEREAGMVSSSVLTQVSILTEEEPHGRLSDTPYCDLESILESPPGWTTTTKSDHEDGHSQAAASSASPSPDSVPHERHTKFQDVQATIALPHVSPSCVRNCTLPLQYAGQIYQYMCSSSMRKQPQIHA